VYQQNDGSHAYSQLQAIKCLSGAI